MPPKNQNAAESVPNRLKITIKEGTKTYVLDSDDLGPADERICRQETGFPLAHFLSQFGPDSIVACVWQARRKSGEPNLSYAQVEKRYPTYKSLDALDVEFDTDFEDEEAPDPLADEDS